MEVKMGTLYSQVGTFNAVSPETKSVFDSAVSPRKNRSPREVSHMSVSKASMSRNGF